MVKYINMKKYIFIFVFLVFIILLILFWNILKIDKKLEEAKFYKIVTPNVLKGWFEIDDDIYQKTNGFVNNISIIAEDKDFKKEQIPYFLKLAKEEIKKKENIIDFSFQKKNNKEYIINLNDSSLNGYYLNKIFYQTNKKNYKISYKVLVSDDNLKFKQIDLLKKEVFNAPEGVSEFLEFNYTDKPFIKVIFSDPIDIKKFYFKKIEKKKIQKIFNNIENTEVIRLKKNYYWIENNKGKYFDRLDVEFKMNGKDSLKFDVELYSQESEEKLILLSHKHLEINSLNNKVYFNLHDKYNNLYLKIKSNDDISIFKVKFLRQKRIIYFKYNKNLKFLKNIKIYYPVIQDKKRKKFEINDSFKKVTLLGEFKNKKSKILFYIDFIEKKMYFIVLILLLLFIFIFFWIKIAKEYKNKTKKDEISI